LIFVTLAVQTNKNYKMKTLFKVTNRVSRQSQILNSEEVNNFFRYLGNGKYQNEFQDYAISTYNPNKNLDTFTWVLISSFTGISVTLLTIKILQEWI
jgi:hypothetical protein